MALITAQKQFQPQNSPIFPVCETFEAFSANKNKFYFFHPMAWKIIDGVSFNLITLQTTLETTESNESRNLFYKTLMISDEINHAALIFGITT